MTKKNICTQSLWDKRFKELGLNKLYDCIEPYQLDEIKNVQYILKEVFSIKCNKYQACNLWLTYSANLDGSWIFLYHHKAVEFLEEFINNHIINNTNRFTQYFPYN